MTDSPLSGRGQGHVRVIHFGLRKFRYSKSSVYRCYQRSCRRSDCGLHLRRSSASWLNARVYYTLVDSNLLIPLGPTSICSGLVVQVVPTLLCSSWRDFDCDVCGSRASCLWLEMNALSSCRRFNIVGCAIRKPAGLRKAYGNYIHYRPPIARFCIVYFATSDLQHNTIKAFITRT